jgi:hypothetical protein
MMLTGQKGLKLVTHILMLKQQLISIAEVETKKTVKMINSANLFSFIMDGSSDISGDEQESTYVRCASGGKVNERFLHIESPPSNCSQDLFNYLMMISDSHVIKQRF